MALKIINGIKIGGLQQKIFNLMLIFIVALVGVYVAVSAWQQRSLSDIVQKASELQQESITAVSEETMNAVNNAISVSLGLGQPGGGTGGTPGTPGGGAAEG